MGIVDTKLLSLILMDCIKFDKEAQVIIYMDNLQEDPIFDKLRTIFDTNFDFEFLVKNGELLVMLKPSISSEVGIRLSKKSLSIDYISYEYDIFGTVDVEFRIDDGFIGIGGIDVTLQDNEEHFNCRR